jgi:hypothetical protein
VALPLSVLRAHEVAEVRSTETGDVPVRALRFLHPDYPVWILRHVWREHDITRREIVAWLRELGGYAHRSVRIRASTAVGMLALEAFDTLCPDVIGPWALDDDAEVRDSAALALGPPAADERLRQTVAAMLQDWGADSTHPALQATAARAYGGSAGLTQPMRSLRLLAGLAEIDDFDVAVAVATSLGELVLQGTTALAGRVLSDVNNWIRRPNRELRLVARLAFLHLTYLRGAPAALGAGDRAYRELPTLLLLALGNPRLLDPVAALWRDGLNSADVHTWLRGSLDDWAVAVEASADARQWFAALMSRTAADRRTAAILSRAAGGWSDPRRSAPRTAQTLLTCIPGGNAHV